jgi:hypothetical protein
MCGMSGMSGIQLHMSFGVVGKAKADIIGPSKSNYGFKVSCRGGLPSPRPFIPATLAD